MMTHLTRKSELASGYFPALFSDGLFSEILRPVAPFAPLASESRGSSWPAVDIRESADGYVLEADVPGVNEKDIKVELNEGMLVLEAERKGQSDSKNESIILLQERSSFRFRRTFELGESIDPEKIQAVYKNGTLTITLPKTERVKPRAIPISVRSN